MYSEGLRDAAVAIIGLAKCTPNQAREAAERVWKGNENSQGDWLFWLRLMAPIVDELKKGSGERPSARHKTL
ncbi:MAG TPA: hypothetical protein VJN18_32455 [Polyangiaceae bacterium]|nr:hypothetical protein [Polyangiaceae bacterium]